MNSPAGSFRTQCQHHVDTRSAGGRQYRRDDCRCQQYERRGSYRQSLGRPYILEITTRQTYEYVPEHHAGDDARNRHHGAFRDDARQ